MTNKSLKWLKWLKWLSFNFSVINLLEKIIIIISTCMRLVAENRDNNYASFREQMLCRSNTFRANNCASRNAQIMEMRGGINV